MGDVVYNYSAERCLMDILGRVDLGTQVKLWQSKTLGKAAQINHRQEWQYVFVRVFLLQVRINIQSEITP